MLHPEIESEEDMLELMRGHEELAHLLLEDAEADRSGISERMFGELARLRELNERQELQKAKEALEEKDRQKDQFIAMLNALASENKINIVSNPHVLTSENKKAVINVSTSVPVVTSQTTGQVAAATSTTTTTTTTAGLNQTVEYRDAGVILTVTPRIGELGTVALDVKQEVNSIGPNVAPTNSPSFIKREAETSVVLVNNSTLVLGGLIQDKVTIDDRGIPLLKTIPIIGYLFGFTERKVEKTELLLLITPRVIGTALDAAKITNEMRQATPGEAHAAPAVDAVAGRECGPSPRRVATAVLGSLH